MPTVVVTETISTHYIDASGNTWNVEVSYGPEAGIPSGATLSVSELTGEAAEGYYNEALKAVENDGNNGENAGNNKKTTLKYAKALDISILKDGVEVRPVAPISVSIKLLDAPSTDEFDEANVVHFGDEVELVDCNVQREAVGFETDAFSVYVVTYTLSTFYMDAAGNTFNIEVEYDREAGIPEGAGLRVSELEGDVAGTYAAQAAEALNVASSQLAYAKALDIAIVKDGEEVTPETPVSVSVRLLDAPEADENTNVNVLHFGEEVETVECALNGETVEFEADGFSVYVVTYTVDFHWGEYTYSIAGESEIRLSELFEQLGVTEIGLADVQDVIFSNEELIKVERQEDDWLLTSLVPFRTEETLTLALRNGQNVEIRVTDEESEYGALIGSSTDNHVTWAEYQKDSEYTLVITVEEGYTGVIPAGIRTATNNNGTKLSDQVTKVIIGEGITGFAGKDTFNGYSKLRDFIPSSTLTSIPQSTFRKSSLQFFDFSKAGGLVSIGQQAFSPANLTSLDLSGLEKLSTINKRDMHPECDRRYNVGEHGVHGWRCDSFTWDQHDQKCDVQ